MKYLVTLMIIAVLILPSSAAAQTAPLIRPTTQDLKSATSGGKDWMTYGGALNDQRYSSLTQINASNVQNLQGAWLTRLGSGTGSKYKFEADPIVIDGMMYIPTGNDDIF